jgi:hypothetical protein
MAEGRAELADYEGTRGSFGGAGHAGDLDIDTLTGTYIGQSSSDCTFKICVAY